MPSIILLPKRRDIIIEVYKIIEIKTIVLVSKKNKSKLDEEKVLLTPTALICTILRITKFIKLINNIANKKTTAKTDIMPDGNVKKAIVPYFFLNKSLL